MRSIVAVVVATAVLLAAPAAAQQDAVERYVDANRDHIVQELATLLRLPNVAADVEDMRRNAALLEEMMERRGIRTRVLETDGPPMVYGELDAPGAQITLLFYAHYDGQPVDPAQWATDPWRPTLRAGSLAEQAPVVDWPETAAGYRDEMRVYARSASDDKAPIVALLTALDALRAAGHAPSVNLKVLLEGDEEIGSPNLPALLREHGELLDADLVVAGDGPAHASGAPTVVFGTRGITSAQITVFGPDRPLHSGHYGNWAPNPAMMLAQLLASMKDDQGRVLVQGWYDDVAPLSAEERAAIARVPAEHPAEFGFAVPEGGPGALRLERVSLPSLNVRGLRSLWVGPEARTLVPDRAVAEIDLRLVPDVRPERQVQRLTEHVRRQGYHVVQEDPDSAMRAAHPKIARVVARPGGYPATRTRFDHPLARRLVRAVARASDQPPILIPMLGGSLPTSWFPALTGTEVVLLPIVNPDNNQHAANENLRLGNLFEGIEVYAAMLTM